MRNSPRSSDWASRLMDEVESTGWTTILAEGMRAPLVSCTAPRKEPREFCATEIVRQATESKKQKVTLRNKIPRFRAKSGVKTREMPRQRPDSEGIWRRALLPALVAWRRVEAA